MRRVGGKGANGAVALAKAGARVSFVGLIGEDSGSLKQTIESYGVNTDQLRTITEVIQSISYSPPSDKCSADPASYSYQQVAR